MNAESEMNRGDGLGAAPTKLDPLDQLKKDTGYAEVPEDGDDGGIDALIDYKNAVEERCRRLESESARAEAALTQCQHIAYDKAIEIGRAMSEPAGRLSAAQLRRLARQGAQALNRINSIAEGGAADPEFVAMLAAADKEDDADPLGEEARAPHKFRAECPNAACHRRHFSLDVDPAGEIPCPTCGTPLRLA